MQETSLVLKRDALGRVRVTRERRAAVVAEFNRSGLSGAQFARLAGMKYPTLMAWVSRGKCVSPAGAPARQSGKRTRLVEAVIAAPEKTAAVVVHLGGGVSVELTEAGQIPLAACLILSLQKPC